MAEQQARPEPGADVGILVTIRSLLPNLAPVERRVARAAYGTALVIYRTLHEESPVDVLEPGPPALLHVAGHRVLADRLRREGLSLSPEADRETLIRRASFASTIVD